MVFVLINEVFSVLDSEIFVFLGIEEGLLNWIFKYYVVDGIWIVFDLVEYF